jgi:hypothetical protein
MSGARDKKRHLTLLAGSDERLPCPGCGAMDCPGEGIYRAVKDRGLAALLADPELEGFEEEPEP